MGLMRQSLNALIVLVFRLLLVDTICIFVTERVVYNYYTASKRISEPDPNCAGEGGIKVIICGFSRSGTSTLRNAMNILGFPCFHGINLVKPGQCRLFMKARKSGKREDWDCLLKGYTSITDFPATSCYKNLIDVYPNAKVILNIRDARKWYKSFSKTVLTIKYRLLPPFTLFSCVKEVLFKDMLKGKEEDMDFAMYIYNLHTEEVKAHVHPQSRLLVYEIGENTRGWAPLCEFLGVQVPLVPFPHSNDTQAYQNLSSLNKTIHHIVVATYFTLLAFTVFFVLKILG